MRMKMMKRNMSLFVVWFLACLLSGCTPIGPDPVSETETATVNPVTTLEFSVFAEREVSVFTNQIISQIGMMNGVEPTDAEWLEKNIEESIHLMNEAYDSVYMEHAPDTDQKEKEHLLEAMEKCLEHMEAYKIAVREEANTDEYKELLRSDFYALTAVTSTFTQ